MATEVPGHWTTDGLPEGCWAAGWGIDIQEGRCPFDCKAKHTNKLQLAASGKLDPWALGPGP
eukprot:4702179-Pyramimonas_sp.AAC.1